MKRDVSARIEVRQHGASWVSQSHATPCPFCGVMAAKTHQQRCDKRPDQCHQCLATLTAASLPAHLLSECPARKAHCPGCDDVLLASNINTHIMAHCTSRSFTCQDCGEVLWVPFEFIQHRTPACPRKVVSCHLCGQAIACSSLALHYAWCSQSSLSQNSHGAQHSDTAKLSAQREDDDARSLDGGSPSYAPWSEQRDEVADGAKHSARSAKSKHRPTSASRALLHASPANILLVLPSVVNPPNGSSPSFAPKMRSRISGREAKQHSPEPPPSLQPFTRPLDFNEEEKDNTLSLKLSLRSTQSAPARCDVVSPSLGRPQSVHRGSSVATTMVQPFLQDIRAVQSPRPSAASKRPLNDNVEEHVRSARSMPSSATPDKRIVFSNTPRKQQVGNERSLAVRDKKLAAASEIIRRRELMERLKEAIPSAPELPSCVPIQSFRLMSLATTGQRSVSTYTK